ncbi:hypothetical protein G6O69_35585 [Pseudenhygromyxa sp. WMMC2535]|uniref:hypothetical protein n=1 Tax=Pseudenhygromyxa sp. WMMC2535 TaxID=2712867 RepID=UPI001552BEAF|nr:hypothetical protein [Pseudenhygromyxa sp. WMMC2535]NVB43201.1 hypothetical protein [Pseudenhygromyxa sp. WMMC2535]
MTRRLASSVGLPIACAGDDGWGRMIRLDRQASVVLREDVAVLVIVDRVDDPRDSLGRTERFSWALAKQAAAKR